MALIRRPTGSSLPSSLEDGSHVSSGDSALYTTRTNGPQNREPSLSCLTPAPASDGGSSGGRGRAVNLPDIRPQSKRSRSRSNTPRPSQVGSDRCVRNALSGQSMGRVRLDGVAMNVFAQIAAGTPAEDSLETLLQEQRRLTAEPGPVSGPASRSIGISREPHLTPET
jgi:hypothetical protein